MVTRRIVFVLGFLGLSCQLLSGSDWPQFRGPNGNNTVSEESRLPTEWSATKNVQWKVAIPGLGWSSPIVVGDKIFITTAITDKPEKPTPFDYSAVGKGDDDDPKDKKDPKDKNGKDAKEEKKSKDSKDDKGPKKDAKKDAQDFEKMFGDMKPPNKVYKFEVMCLDRNSGKILWQKTALEGKPTIAKFPTNSYASETPVTDGERVFAYFGMHGLFCYDLDGKLLWKKELGSYSTMMGFGTGSSPALDDGKLFIQCDNDEKSFLVALDAKTGDQIWKVDRKGKTSWSTPFVWKTKNRTELVVCGDGNVTSYDPKTSKVIWELKGMEGGFATTPSSDSERIYFGNSGQNGPGTLYCVKAGATGDITPKKDETKSDGVVWSRARSGPGIASSVLYQDLLYITEGARIHCYKAATGEPAYLKERLEGARGFTSSPWAYNGKIFCLDEDGKVFVIKAGPEFELLGKNTLSEMFWASPAIASGSLILRGAENLYCVKQ
jgi:outer membrane protein assembly factor BamB